MAASSLQNSSSTITPSSNVMWSMLRKRKKKISRESRLAHRKTSLESWRICSVFTHMGPSGSRPKRRFLTSRSLGVKSGMRWILTMRSPTTCEAQCHQHTKLTPSKCARQQGEPAASSAQDAEARQHPHRLTKQHAEYLLCPKKG